MVNGYVQRLVDTLSDELDVQDPTPATADDDIADLNFQTFGVARTKIPIDVASELSDLDFGVFDEKDEDADILEPVEDADSEEYSQKKLQ